MTPEWVEQMVGWYVDGVAPGSTSEVTAATRSRIRRDGPYKVHRPVPQDREPVRSVSPAPKVSQRPPLPLAEARARIAARKAVKAPVGASVSAGSSKDLAKPPVPVQRPSVALPLGRAIAAREADRAHRAVPDAFPGALRFVASGVWRHVSFAASLGNYTRLERLASGMAARGPWTAVTAAVGALPDSSGLCEFLRADSGEEWVRVTVDRARSGGDVTAALKHEIGHIAYELAEFERARDVEVWRAGLPDRADPSEPFAVWCESNIGERTTVDGLVAAANDRVRRSSRLPLLNSVRTNRKKA